MISRRDVALLSLMTVATGSLGHAALPAQNPLAREAQNPLTRQAPNAWVGTFRGTELAMTLRADDGAYSGSIELGGHSYTATAQRGEDGGISGIFRVGAEEFAFSATRSGPTVTLRSGGTRYEMTTVEMTRLDATPARDGSRTAPGSEGAAKTTASALELKSFRHPIGFHFQHPAAWRVQSDDAAILLLPDDAKRDPRGQPLEFFLVSGEDAEGIERTDDPRVLQFFDEAVRQSYPAMRRTGAPAALTSLLGPGTVLTYEGKTPTGIDAIQTIYVALHRGLGVFMMHVGDVEQAKKRQGIARQMFSSFGWEKGKTDEQLVGLWHRNEMSASTSLGVSGSIDSVGSSSNLYWEFQADGTVRYAQGTRVFGNVGGGVDGSGSQVSILSEGGGNKPWVGSWSVAGTRLHVLWNGGGAETYEYSVFAHTEGRTALKLLVPGERKPKFFIKQ